MKKKLYSGIKLFVSDIDGTLTDGGMYYSATGEVLKKFNTKDGKAFELLRVKGIKTCLMTSEETDITASRASKMKIDYVYEGVTGYEKKDALISLCKELEISQSNTAYIGDDVNCIEALKFSGVKACPLDASYKVKSVLGIYICKSLGGGGAVREFADLILENLYEDF